MKKDLKKKFLDVSTGPGDMFTNSTLNPGDIVDVIMLQRLPGMSIEERKEYELKQGKERAQAEKRGVRHKEDPITYKEYGVRWDCAIIRKFPKGKIREGGDLIIGDDGRIIEQSARPFISLFQQNFRKHFERGFYEPQLLADNLKEDGFPQTIYYPHRSSPYTVKDSRVPIDQEPESVINLYNDLYEKEMKRKSAWQRFIGLYEKLDEDEAIETLEDRLAMLYGMKNVVGSEIESAKLEPGLIFRTGIKSVTKFTNLAAYKRWHDGKSWETQWYPIEYDNTIGDYLWKNTEVTNESRALAELIMDTKNKYFEELKLKKAGVKSEFIPEYDESLDEIDDEEDDDDESF